MTMGKLAERVDRILAGEVAERLEKVPSLYLLRETEPTQIEATIYEPIVCLIVQGEKETIVGDHAVTVRQGQSVVVSHDLPVLARITKASPRKPYLAIIIELDLGVLRSLHDELDETVVEPASARALEVGSVDDATIKVIERYLDLLDDPVGARVLLPLVQKELHFRLLMSEPGAMLRSLLRRDSHASNITRAINALRESFRDSLDVADLAKSVGMSTSSFHKHFKTMTMTTPLQYQKDLRLTEARRLLRAAQGTVSTIAFDVGYESASQFSREYSRKFGAPPRSDLQVA